LADVVETAVPGKAMARLARRAAERGRTLPCLVEVDFTGERAGVAPEDVVGACDAVAAADGLALRGLMTVPPIGPSGEAARPYFRRLRELLAKVASRHPEAVELSMGMSPDYEVAVEEGATMVRIGTALFGARPSG
ncbi:MAG: alanine racemase, partial [Actinomycetota bacterium]